MISFALNHMTTPHLGHDQVLSLATSLGCAGVEFRNDLSTPLFGDEAPSAVATKTGALQILALAEVKAFNDFSDETRAQATLLAKTANACGAQAIVLIPRNDGGGLGNGERQAKLRVALRELRPVLDEHDLIGLVEPLGFETCALRSKAELVETIEALGAADRYRIVHDTFHHALAGGGPLFAAHTGIVHISGVTDPTPSLREMRDPHRGLVGPGDRLGSVEQIAALMADGYAGPVSFEAFAPETHSLTDPAAALRRSIAFIEAQLQELAA